MQIRMIKSESAVHDEAGRSTPNGEVEQLGSIHQRTRHRLPFSLPAFYVARIQILVRSAHRVVLKTTD